MLKEQVLKFIGNKEYIIVAMGNFGFLKMIINWAWFLKKLSIDNYLVFAFDKETYSQLTRLKINTCLFHQEKQTSLNPQKFATPEFNQITYSKISVVHMLLKENLNLLLSDVDTVWLDNPQNHIDFKEDFDLQIQVNNERLPLTESSLSLNTGFFYARANDKTANFFEQVLLEMEHNPKLDDQTCLNIVVQREKDRLYIALPEAASRHNHSLLQIKALSPLLFPNGNLYFHNHAEFKRYGVKPIVIHANFYDGLKEKIHILNKFKYWKTESRLKSYLKRLLFRC